MVVNKEKDTLHYYAEVAQLYKYDRYKQLFGSQYFYLERKDKCISLNISNGNVSRDFSLSQKNLFVAQLLSMVVG